MRLIDADALHCNFFDYTPREYVWDRGDIEHKINEMPTISAIPVEWLKKVQTECVCDVQQIPMYVAIGWLRDMWQKEQEAQDG